MNQSSSQKEESSGQRNVPRDVMENIYPSGADPLEGVQLLGINYYPKTGIAREGLLASKEVIFFADDNLLR